MNRWLSRVLPRNYRGRLVSPYCPECGNGTLFLEGGLWRCDGLADPEDENLPLDRCEFAILAPTAQQS